MRKICLFVCVACLCATELEVDGNLTVTGDINSPTIDALSGMTPDRIYRLIQPNDGSTFVLTVPENKFWRIELWGGATGYNSFTATTKDYCQLAINGATIELSARYGNGWSRTSVYTPITLVAGDVISNNIYNNGFTEGGLTIYEYSISGSGSEQGMDYIVP